MPTIRHTIAILAVGLIVGACGSSTTLAPAAPATPAPPVARASTPAAPASSASVAGPSTAPVSVDQGLSSADGTAGTVPAALQGTWRVEDAVCPTCTASFSFSDSAYSDFTTDKMIGGPASVTGDSLTLGAASVGCPKSADYLWTLVSATELVLTPIGSDSCDRGQDIGSGRLKLDSRDVYLNYATPLSGAIPDALTGTWQSTGSAGHLVLAGHQAAFYGDDIASHTLTGAGASATDLTFGPRLGGGCQAIGLYHWQLVIPTQLVLTHANNDSCPRAQGLGAAPLDLVSRSTAPIS